MCLCITFIDDTSKHLKFPQKHIFMNNTQPIIKILHIEDSLLEQAFYEYILGIMSLNSLKFRIFFILLCVVAFEYMFLRKAGKVFVKSSELFRIY